MLICINLIVTTNQKSIMNTHTQKKKKFRYNTKDSHLITRKQHKRRIEQKVTSKQFLNNE